MQRNDHMTHMTRLVLGSASPGRLKVLRQAGIDPLVMVSGVDEDRVTAALGSDVSPGDVVCALARAKAEQVGRASSIAPSLRIALSSAVIRCFTSTAGYAASRNPSPMHANFGSRWQAAPANCIPATASSGCWTTRIVHRDAETSITTVHFGTPSPDDLEAYLACGESLRVAGGFTLDGLGGWFIDGVDGDPSAVVGIGLPLTRSLLASRRPVHRRAVGGQSAQLRARVDG